MALMEAMTEGLPVVCSRIRGNVDLIEEGVGGYLVADVYKRQALKKLLTYMKSVYKIPQKIKCLTDERKRKSIPLFNIVMPVLLSLIHIWMV